MNRAVDRTAVPDAAPPAAPIPCPAGYVADRPDLGHVAEGWNLADPAFFAVGSGLLPPAAYRSLAFANLEDDAVWTRAWLCIGFAHEIPGCGDLLSFTAGHHGVHVQRGADGTLAGRFNMAQHGGCRAVPLQCRTGTKTRCSFTACGYSRDGDPLPAGPDGLATPAMHQFLGLRPERLLPVATRKAGPLILANLDPAAAEFEPLPLPPVLHRLDGRVVYRLEVEANWKLVLAALAGCDRVFPTGRPDRFAGSGQGIDDDADRRPVTVSALFPNLVLLCDAADGGCAVILQPTALGRTLCRITMFGSAPDRWLAEIEARNALSCSLQRAVFRLGGADADRPAADIAARWLQAQLAARILSRPETGVSQPLYTTASGRR